MAHLRNMIKHIEIDTPEELFVLGVPRQMRLSGNWREGFGVSVKGDRQTFMFRFDFAMAAVRGKIPGISYLGITIKAWNSRYELLINNEKAALRAIVLSEYGYFEYANSGEIINERILNAATNDDIRAMFDDRRINTYDTEYLIRFTYDGKDSSDAPWPKEGDHYSINMI